MSDPNIGTQALLASLSFGMPRQSRQLKREAEKVEEDNGAQRGVAKVSVYYFQQQQGKETIDALADVKSHFNYWRKEHMRLTIPWMSDMRLLAGPVVPTYLNMRSQMEEIAPVKAAEFFGVHPDWEVTAPTRMGHLYDRADFPNLDSCREAIRWQTILQPLPEAAQWTRIAMINPEHAQAEQQRYNEGVTRARESARMETWRELLGHFQHITEVLSRDKVRIHETLIGGLTQMLDLIPAYGPLFNDEGLIRCATEARELLGSITADDLRADPAIREQAVSNARDLIARFGQLGARRFA